MATKAKLNPKEVRDDVYEEKAKLKAIEEKIYQTMEVSKLLGNITDLNAEITRLKDLLSKALDEQREEKDSYIKASRRLEKDLDQKIQELEDMTKELNMTKKEYEDKLQALAAQKNEEIAGLKSEIYNIKFELNKKVGELDTELQGLKEFKLKQEEYYNDTESLKRKCDDLIHTHNDDMKKTANANSEKIQMQQDKHEKEINQIKHEAKKQAEQEVEKLERKVIDDNKKLQEDLLKYKKEVDILRRERERAVDENKQIKQNISIQEDGVVEYQAIHFRQESKIRKLKEKIQLLKTYISQEVNGHTKELETAKYQYQVRIADLESQVQRLTDEATMKLKENKRLKTLSQIILDQRSEIEEFLLETLDHVKEEVRKQRANERKLKLPEISSRSKLESKRKDWDKIEFSSLDWEDKEKILRILFSKMNSGLLPANWRTSTLERSSELMNNSNGLASN